MGGVEGSTRGEEVPELDGPIVGNVEDELRATGDVGDDVDTEAEDSVSEGTCGATPTAGRNAKTSEFRDGTTSERRCERPPGENAMRGPNDEARGVGSSSKLSHSLFATDCETSVSSRDVRVWFEASEVGSTMLRLLLARTLVADSLPKIACNKTGAT